MTTEKRTTYTPGPWGLQKHLSVDEPMIHVCDVFWTKLATVYVDTRNMAEDEANARLISAAPELLEALQAMVGHCESGDVLIRDGLTESAHQAVHDAAIEARAAIAKALGTSS